MVIDKEIKMRETLKILSMQTSAYGLSYFMSQLIFTVVIAFLLTVTFLILQFVTPVQGLLYFLALVFQGMGMTSFSMALTTIFSDSKISV